MSSRRGGGKGGKKEGKGKREGSFLSHGTPSPSFYLSQNSLFNNNPRIAFGKTDRVFELHIGRNNGEGWEGKKKKGEPRGRLLTHPPLQSSRDNLKKCPALPSCYIFLYPHQATLRG